MYDAISLENAWVVPWISWGAAEILAICEFSEGIVVPKWVNRSLRSLRNGQD